MVPLGSEYAIGLNNPDLVLGLIWRADGQPACATAGTYDTLRVRIARVLRALATRLEPPARALEPLASPRQRPARQATVTCQSVQRAS